MVPKLVKAQYSSEEVEALIAEAVEKAVKQDREFLARLLRALPTMDRNVKQGWIENLLSLSRALISALCPPVVKVANIIDTDAYPFCPDGWRVEEHRKAGKLEWDPAKVILHLDKGQKNGRWLEGNKLRKALKNQPVMNACVLDWLLAHPKFIPEEWKDRRVFFWGTIYFDQGDGLFYVRHLSWNGEKWYWNCYRLDSNWGDDNYLAAMAA